MPADPTNPASRLWRKDVSLWRAATGNLDGIPDRLGWLDSIGWMQTRAGELAAWARGIAESGRYDRVIVLGMGGSSLAPAVFASLFAPAPGGLPLAVLDTTDPDEITRIAQIARIDGYDLRRCLFIVASKSGDTVETLDLYEFFRAALAARCPDPESRFVVITDAGSPLHRLGQAERCRKIFLNPKDIGGRYSALSYFGLAPAALLGVNIGEVLARAQDFCATTRSDEPRENPALALGMLLGRGARAGRDKLILRLPAGLGVFGLWVEQLIAESTGKDGKGLVPVLAGDGATDTEGAEGADCGDDRITIDIAYGGGRNQGSDDEKQRAHAADYALRIDDPHQIGAEFFRWEFATAIAASYLAVNPFDQPDVARSKDNTRRFIAGRGRLPGLLCRGARYDVRHPATAGDGHSAARAIADFRRCLTPEGYLAVLAYLPEDAQTLALLRALREQAAARWRIAVTLGFGPRYLHSTGQLHKGGPPGGRFIQLLADPRADLAAPRRPYTFAQLYRAQADGDFAALADAGRAVMRVDLKADRLRALAAFIADFTGRDVAC